ncbi:MAG: hypothetical protein QOH57_5412 [Mycobacterium sp.]|jgi:hypothetical protein|nr:hypothetical protein [Mycobacterium sp.]
MDVPARKLRTGLSTAAAAVAVPAVILASAGTAHATVRGLNVNFDPVLGGIGVQVQDTVGAGKQNCSYDSKPESGLGFPFHKDFVLGLNGTTSWQIPGIATGTLWRVHIGCTYDPPNQFAKPGLFDDTVTF